MRTIVSTGSDINIDAALTGLWISKAAFLMGNLHHGLLCSAGFEEFFKIVESDAQLLE